MHIGLMSTTFCKLDIVIFVFTTKQFLQSRATTSRNLYKHGVNTVQQLDHSVVDLLFCEVIFLRVCYLRSCWSCLLYTSRGKRPTQIFLYISTTTMVQPLSFKESHYFLLLPIIFKGLWYHERFSISNALCICVNAWKTK